MFAIFWLMNMLGYAPAGGALFSGGAILHGLFAALPIAASGIATLVLYNGRKSEKYVQFNKWFFLYLLSGPSVALMADKK